MTKVALKKEKLKYSCSSTDEKENIRNSLLLNIYNAIREINYGSVQIHIQNGKVVQIDKVNKVRMR